MCADTAFNPPGNVYPQAEFAGSDSDSISRLFIPSNGAQGTPSLPHSSQQWLFSRFANLLPMIESILPQAGVSGGPQGPCPPLQTPGGWDRLAHSTSQYSGDCCGLGQVPLWQAHGSQGWSPRRRLEGGSYKRSAKTPGQPRKAQSANILDFADHTSLCPN